MSKQNPLDTINKYLAQIPETIPLIWKGAQLVKSYTGKRALKSNILSALTFSNALAEFPNKTNLLAAAISAKNAVLIADEHIEETGFLPAEIEADIVTKLLLPNPELSHMFSNMVGAMQEERTYIGRPIEFERYLNTVVTSNAFDLVALQLALSSSPTITEPEIDIINQANAITRDLTDLLVVSPDDILQGSNLILRADQNYDPTRPEVLLEMDSNAMKKQLLSMRHNYYELHTKPLLLNFSQQVNHIHQPTEVVRFSQSIVEQLFIFVAGQKGITD